MVFLASVGKTLLLVALLFCCVDCFTFDEVQRELSLLCSSTSVPKLDQRLLGHGDILLSTFTRELLPVYTVKSEIECASKILEDWIKSNLETNIVQSEDGIFHFSLFHHDQDHSDWKIEALKVGVSGLPVYRIQLVSGNSQTEEFYVKLYPYPQATDAFNAELFSSYATRSIKENQFFSLHESLLSKQCFIPESNEIFYVSLSKKIPGKSLKTILTELIQDPKNKEKEQKLHDGILRAARALGEFHSKSSSIVGDITPQFIFLTETMEELFNLKLGNAFPESILNPLAKQTEVLLNNAKKSIINIKDKSIIPNIGCFSHFDVTTSNIIINDETVTFFDSPLMYRSFSFAPFEPECETQSYLANPLIPIIGTNHPAFDYYFFVTYLSLEITPLDELGLLKNMENYLQKGYCQGWFSGDSDKLKACENADKLWTPEVELFYMQYMVIYLSPKSIADLLYQSLKDQFDSARS